MDNEVAASMKGNAYYASTVAVTKNSLCATKCTCKAGSHGLQRGVCVHNLPLIFRLILLLVDGLSNHILVELCQRWNSHLESKIDGLGKLEMVKRAVLLLMKSNGSENTSSLFHLSVNEILKNRFNVGTEKAKIFTQQEPKDEELIPLRLMDIASDNNKAKKKLKRLQFEGSDSMSEDVEDCVITSSRSDKVEVVARDSDDNASSGADSDVRLAERDDGIDFEVGAEDGVMKDDGDRDRD